MNLPPTTRTRTIDAIMMVDFFILVQWRDGSKMNWTVPTSAPLYTIFGSITRFMEYFDLRQSRSEYTCVLLNTNHILSHQSRFSLKWNTSLTRRDLDSRVNKYTTTQSMTFRIDNLIRIASSGM